MMPKRTLQRRWLIGFLVAANGLVLTSVGDVALGQPQPGDRDGRGGGAGTGGTGETRRPDRAPPRRPEGIRVSSAVTRLLEADYLSDEERKDRRLFHGLWKASDIDTPARAAKAALMAGAADDPALKSADAD